MADWKFVQRYRTAHIWRIPARRANRYWYAFTGSAEPPKPNEVEETYNSLKSVRRNIDFVHADRQT